MQIGNIQKSELERNLTYALNYSSIDTALKTPNFILAKYLIQCLEAFGTAREENEKWASKAD